MNIFYSRIICKIEIFSESICKIKWNSSITKNLVQEKQNVIPKRDIHTIRMVM